MMVFGRAIPPPQKGSDLVTTDLSSAIVDIVCVIPHLSRPLGVPPLFLAYAVVSVMHPLVEFL